VGDLIGQWSVWLYDITKNPQRVERKQAGLCPASKYILLRHSPFSRTTVYSREVFFVDICQASTVAALDFISVRCFQWPKNRHVTGLCLVRRVRGQSTKDDVILEAKFDDLKGFVCPKAIADEYPWLPISTSFSLRVKNSFNPLQADKGVIVTCFRKSIEPSRIRVCDGRH
jgi:hypothetical protein